MADNIKGVVSARNIISGAVNIFSGWIRDIIATSPLSASVENQTATITHDISGVTAGSKGDTTNQTPTFGSTFKVLSGTVNATGHLTAFAEHTVKIPSTAATVATAGLMTAGDKIKLNSIAAGAEVNVQPDWNQTDTTADNYIQNKPNTPIVYDLGTVTVTNNTFSITAAQKSDIVEAWNTGYFVLKLTVDNKDYYVAKERIITNNNINVYGFVGVNADASLYIYTGKVIVGIDIDNNFGLFSIIGDFISDDIEIIARGVVSELTAADIGAQPTLTAGYGIDITNNVISLDISSADNTNY